jgi:hypothetical protein
MYIVVLAVYLHDNDDNDYDNNHNNNNTKKIDVFRQARWNITDYCNGYLDCLVRTANW